MATRKLDCAAIGIELESLAKADQEMRSRSSENGEFWDEQVDYRNTERLKSIVGEIGLPTIPKVGQKAASDAWLLAQHADHDIEFQKEYLNLMKEAATGEISKKNIAFLEDRIAISEGRLQIYGTQFKQNSEGKLVPLPIKDKASVDERRRKMGLDTFKENQERIQKIYGRNTS